jgi:hypothetical protein
MGRTSMPGWRSGHSRKLSPRWRGLSEVRASRKIQLASRALDVQVFCPSMCRAFPLHQPRPRAQRGEVGSRAGLGEALAPAVLAGQRPRQEPRLLLRRSQGEQRVADHLEAEIVGAPAGRGAGLGEFFYQHHLLELAEPAAAVLSRPGHAEQAVLMQQAAPAVGERLDLTGRERADALPAWWQVNGKEFPHLDAEKLGLAGVGQVHAASSSI